MELTQGCPPTHVSRSPEVDLTRSGRARTRPRAFFARRSAELGPKLFYDERVMLQAHADTVANSSRSGEAALGAGGYRREAQTHRRQALRRPGDRRHTLATAQP